MLLIPSRVNQPPSSEDTKDSQRNHHHVVDGPLVGNGNIGIAVGGGNLWNVSCVTSLPSPLMINP